MDINFYNIKDAGKGKADSFESLACSIFHKKFNDCGVYRCFFGAGGDGGVEAVFYCPDGSELVLQAKYWENRKFESSQIRQLTDSFKTAIQNHPNLKKYYVAIPFDLTGKVAGGKKGISQTEKFDKWASDCKKIHSVDIILWSESVLRDILLEVDVSRGLQRFWFEQNFLTEIQYRHYLEESVASAGKKYTPDLKVGVPLMDTLNSFSNPDVLNQQCEERINFIKKFFLNNDSFRDAFKSNFEGVDELVDLLRKLEHRKNNEDVIKKMESICPKLSSIAEMCEKEQLRLLEEQFGDKFVDNRNFRDFHAQYMCDFPAAKLDKVREFQKFISNFLSWMHSDLFRASFSNILVVKGPAGIGKTFSVIDYALLNNNARHYIFFGSDFNNDEPWITFLKKLGLSISLSKDELFGSLEAYADGVDKISIIFIDALNESKCRENWKHWLPSLKSDISRYPHLKLCVTCRNTFLSDVFENEADYISVEHNGFLGQERLAIRSFFDYYNLKEPLYPLFSQEFDNPLFLRLFCESFQPESFADFPRGKIGLKIIYQRYLEKKSKIIAKKCNIDPESDCVYAYLASLAKEMSSIQQNFVERSKAVDLSKRIHNTPNFSTSLFSVMEQEGLLIFRNDGSVKRVYFAYERMADYFVAQKLISDEKLLCNTLANDKWLLQNGGVLEMLSILLPEQNGKEICDYFNDNQREIWFDCFIEGLPWRSNDSITDKTKDILRKLLLDSRLVNRIFSALVGLSVVPGNPLNIDCLENILMSRSLCDRDPGMAYAFRLSFENKDSVYKVIDWALHGDLKKYSNESVLLWSKILCWLFASPDRRIRDKSSKAFVRILLAHFEQAFLILDHFKNTDDEYITERIFEAIYAALLLSHKQDDCINVAKDIIAKKYLEKYENIIIHDTCRLIVELAHTYDKSFVSLKIYKECGKKCTNKYFKKVDEKLYQGLVLRSEFSSQNINFVGYWYTDFQRYVLVNKTENFDIKSKGISYDDIYKWLVVNLYNLGYPGEKSRAWLYDTRTLGSYGLDRMRAVYAERLSKKYYWILLHRLVGLLQNTVPYKKKSWDTSLEPSERRLHSLRFRQIDLTDIRYDDEIKYPVFAFKSPIFTFSAENEKNARPTGGFYDVEDIVDNTYDEEKKKWVPLHLYLDKYNKEDPLDIAYRNSCCLIVAYITTKKFLDEMLKSKKKFSEFVSGAPFQSDSQEYELYLGEYPIARSYAEKLETQDLSETESSFGELTKTSFEFLRGNEWEYDCSYEGLDEKKEQELHEAILFPSKMLIEKCALKWDNNYGWRNFEGELVVFQRNNVLLIENEMLKNFLGMDKVLLFNSYREQIYSSSSNKKIASIRSAYQYDGRNLKIMYERKEN